MKLFTITLDNMSNNDTLCEMVKEIHQVRKYDDWNCDENQIPYDIFQPNLWYIY